MGRTVKVCRVCGKEYEACHTQNRISAAFRYQSVACSPECGAIYLQRVREARGQAVDQAPVEEPVNTKPSVEPESVEAVASDEKTASFHLTDENSEYRPRRKKKNRRRY